MYGCFNSNCNPDKMVRQIDLVFFFLYQYICLIWFECYMRVFFLGEFLLDVGSKPNDGYMFKIFYIVRFEYNWRVIDLYV